MIVWPDRFVLFTPPRTASRAIHRALQAFPVEVYQGPSVSLANATIAHDTTFLPARYSHLPIYLSVRHPADRLVSLWPLVREWPGPLETPDWQDFVRKVGARDETFYCAWWWTISDFARGIPVRGTVRYEKLSGDLCRLLGQAVDVPLVGASQRDRDWRAYFDSELTQIGQGWAREDLDQYGYTWV